MNTPKRLVEKQYFESESNLAPWMGLHGSLHKKRSFSLRISSVHVTKSWEALYGKLHFSCSGGKPSCPNSNNVRKTLGVTMLSLNKLLSYVVKNTETVMDYLFWEHLEHKKIAESLGQIVKKYIGRNQILETRSTT